MNPLHYISIRRWNILWPRIKEYIRGMISNAMSPSDDKEVISVLTYDEVAPSLPEENDYYINSEENKLYKYIEDAWVEQDASADCVYIAEDTARVYVFQNNKFQEATGGVVNGIIYMKSINDVGKINDLHTGIYTAKVGKKAKTIYTLIVKENYATYQTLYNHWGFYSRVQNPATGEWSDWNEHDYAIKGLIRDNFLVKYDDDTEKLVDAGINADNVASKLIKTAASVSSNVITLNINKAYDLTSISPLTDSNTIHLSETGAITNECPQWHFFFECGSSMPVFQLDTEDVDITWDTDPDWSNEDLVEVNVIKVGVNYFGLWSKKNLD